MKYHSTNRKSKGYTFEEILLAGLAPDGGLFMPEKIVELPAAFWKNLEKNSFYEIAENVVKRYVENIQAQKIHSIIREAFNFPIPLRKLQENLYVLELFHGPTAAFKDFGARFMSRVFSHYLAEKREKVFIITATSGDTGSAVASGFYNVPNVQVFILYPSHQVSPLQEQQLTTFGSNIIALEVQGTFDDCQRLAKQVITDLSLPPPLNLPLGQGEKGIRVSSANSINFGRLLPQSLYYIWGLAELRSQGITEQPVYVVPSGNFGNLMGGLLAYKMGAPIDGFVAATNINKVVPEYLRTGKFNPKKSKKTLSNAMDVGNPSNFARMLHIFQNNHNNMQKKITGVSINDKETRRTMQDIYHASGYVIDPHTAVGIAAAKRAGLKKPTIVLATAHPAKFLEIVEPTLDRKMSIPLRLRKVLKKKKKSTIIKNDMKELKRIILNHGFPPPDRSRGQACHPNSEY